jgi:hypothetical protein
MDRGRRRGRMGRDVGEWVGQKSSKMGMIVRITVPFVNMWISVNLEITPGNRLDSSIKNCEIDGVFIPLMRRGPGAYGRSVEGEAAR